MVPGVFGRAPRTDRRRKGQARRVAARNRRGQLYYAAAQVSRGGRAPNLVANILSRAFDPSQRSKGVSRAETFVAVRRRAAAGFTPPLQGCFLAGLCSQLGDIVKSLMNPPELRGVRILADMTNAQLQMLLTYGQVLPFAPGQIIVGQGNTAEALFLLVEGK